MCECDMQVRLDHRYGTVHFGGQQLESDRVRDHISALARRLTKALGMIQPEVPKETEARRLKVSADLHMLTVGWCRGSSCPCEVFLLTFAILPVVCTELRAVSVCLLPLSG